MRLGTRWVESGSKMREEGEFKKYYTCSALAVYVRETCGHNG